MADKQIPPPIMMIIGTIVLVVSLVLNARTKSNFVLFVIVGGVMILYGAARFIFNRSVPKEHTRTNKHQHAHMHAHQQAHHRPERPYQQHQQQHQQQYQQPQSHTKFCPRCGSRVHVHAKFCHNCGARL